MATNTAYTPSWFNRINYIVQEKLDALVENDPVLSLFTDRTDQGNINGRAPLTMDLTGRANEYFANFKVEGQKVISSDAVEEDQLSKEFLSLGARQVFSWESFLHDKYDYIGDVSSELANNIMRSVYLALTCQIHNSATATTVTLPGGVVYDIKTPDGVALISASHTTPSGLTGLTNIGGTGALSEVNLTANILVGQENMRTSSGVTIPYNPDLLIVPSVEPMVKKAQQITGSDQVESTANNAINIYGGGRMKVMVLNYAPLTGLGVRDTSTAKYAWSTADSTMLKKILHYKWAAKPQSYPRFMDSENGDSSFLVLSRFSFGASRWQGIVRNNATTAPTDSSEA